MRRRCMGQVRAELLMPASGVQHTGPRAPVDSAGTSQRQRRNKLATQQIASPSACAPSPLQPGSFLLFPCLSASPPHRRGKQIGSCPPQALTHHSGDTQAPGARLGLGLQGLESGPRKQTQALAAPARQAHGLEGAEGWGRGFLIPC